MQVTYDIRTCLPDLNLHASMGVTSLQFQGFDSMLKQQRSRSGAIYFLSSARDLADAQVKVVVHDTGARTLSSEFLTC
jgi:hypothetical protein